jgi:serine/threonine-protein kinase
MDDLATPDDALIGRIIAGKFGLRRCVGAGASGSVYQADQLALGRTVAIKILRAELAQDPRFVARFHDEALAASRLNHPNTVSVIDYGQTEDGLLYLVMEFLRGTTLTQVLRSEQLRPARIADIVSQILSGLEEAHEAGVVHADLKADNVVVERRRGNWDLVKVVDFGIARLIGRPAPQSEERTICGTPEYMAPELIQAEDPTFLSDLYAVGVMIYELLIGVTPFAGGQAIEILRRHLVDSPMPPSLRRPDLKIDPVLEQCAMRSLSKDPALRFASATELRNELSRVTAIRSGPGSQVATCSECGSSSPVGFKFCPECGEPQQSEAAGVVLLDKPVGGPGAPKVGTMLDGTSATLAGLPALVEDTGLVDGPANAEILGTGLGDLPLVGRDAELERLVRFLAATSDDNAIQIIGPRGSGRSRLIREALERVESIRILEARPDPAEIVRPFFPVRQLVRQALGLDQARAPGDLRQRMDALGLSPRDAPAIAELLGLEGPLWQLEPAVRRREMLASAGRLFLALAERPPVVLVLEEVDRYDQPSQEVVRRIVDSAQGRGGLRIVLSAGLEMAGRLPPSMQRIELGRLERRDLVALTHQLHQRGIGQELLTLQQLEEHGGGSPGHLQHLARYVVEGGAASTAPANLADLVAARIDHLPHSAKLLCQALSVLGEEGPLAWVFRLSGDDHAEVRQALSIALARNLTRVVSDGEALQFTSELIRDVVYDSIPAHVRRDLHARAAELLADIGAEPGVLGHHQELAGDLNDAAGLLSRAGDDALHELDETGARRLYQRALAAARGAMLSDDDANKRSQFVAIAVKLAESLRLSGQTGLARGLLSEVEFQCADSRALRAQLLRALAHLHGSEGNLRAALDALREAIGVAIVTGQRDLLCELYLDVATTQLREAIIPDTTRELEEGIDLVTAGEGVSAADGPVSLWRLLHRLAQLKAMEGRRGEAVEVAGHALRHAFRVNARVGAARIQSMLAGYLEEMGESKRAVELRRAAVDEMRRLGDRRATAELLLDGVRPTRTYAPIAPASLREAQELAEEIGWSEGMARAAKAAPRAG